MIKIVIGSEIYICSRQLNYYKDIVEELYSIGYNYQKEFTLFYFIDGECDKVVLNTDDDLIYFKEQKVLKLYVENRNRNQIVNRDIVKDALKLKIMQLLQQY